MFSNNNDKSLLDSLNAISSKLSFKNDPRWIHLETTIKVLTYCLIQKINTCISLINAQQYSIDESTTAGTLYNGIYVTHPYSSNTQFTDEILDNDFKEFCIIFKSTMDQVTGPLSSISQTIDDPFMCTFDFLHFLFIPVRVDISTLSTDIKINSLRKFLTVIMFLPYMESYTERYLTAINNVEFVQKVHSTISDINNKSNIAEQMINMKYEFINKSLQPWYTSNNSMMIYLRVYTNIVLLICIEIMKKWCPNINECMRINPDFDGTWVNPFDTIVNEQLQVIQEMAAHITKTEKIQDK